VPGVKRRPGGGLPARGHRQILCTTRALDDEEARQRAAATNLPGRAQVAQHLVAARHPGGMGGRAGLRALALDDHQQLRHFQVDVRSARALQDVPGASRQPWPAEACECFGDRGRVPPNQRLASRSGLAGISGHRVGWKRSLLDEPAQQAPGRWERALLHALSPGGEPDRGGHGGIGGVAYTLQEGEECGQPGLGCRVACQEGIEDGCHARAR
jgi:hypothetical protein